MLEISTSDVRRSLSRDNPWWQPDHRIPSLFITHRRIYFEPFVRLALSWSVRRSTILLGPRRVGKTVLLQQLIYRAIADGFPAQNILFVSIDTPIYSGLGLGDIVDLFEQTKPVSGDNRRIVVFDEIQYLRNWEVHLKVLTDQHPNIKFLASGSAAAALRLKSQESGAGRFTEFLLPPLTFAEFLDFSGTGENLVVKTSDGTAPRYETRDIDALNLQFMNYLNYGGYPEAVLNRDIREDTQRYLGRDIIDKVLLRDLPSLYGIDNIQELNRLFAMLAYQTGQEISLEQLSKSSGVNKNTITKYMEYLEAAFLIARVRRIDETGRTFQRARQFKVYLTNPSMRAALFSPLDAEDGAMGALVETALYSQWFHSGQQMSGIHYARWKKGRSDFEVDLVKLDKKQFRPEWAYEVKWSDRFATTHSHELTGLLELAKLHPNLEGRIGATTRTVTSETIVQGLKVRHFPCSLHCYQIGRNLASGLQP